MTKILVIKWICTDFEIQTTLSTFIMGCLYAFEDKNNQHLLDGVDTFF